MYKVLIWGLLLSLGSPKIPAWSQQSMPPATPQREQSPPSAESSIEIQNYAPYNIALLPDKTGAEIVLPFMTVENRLAFFTLSQVQQASKDKKLLGRLISYGELISLIGDLQVQVNQLKQENDKLWAVVGKSSTPQTVIVQQSSPPASSSRNDALSKYVLLRQLFPTAQPYQLPMPQHPNNGVTCTTRYIGSTSYTDCR